MKISTAIAVWLLASLPLLAVAQDSQEPPERIVSPDGKTSVRILHQAMPGNDGVSDYFTIEVAKGRQAIVCAPTEGYLMSAHWSPDGRLLAVNNRRGNSGEYMWVFDLSGAKIVKRPDDNVGEKWIKSGLKQIQKLDPSTNKESPYSYWFTSNGWDDGSKLRITLRARYTDRGTFTSKAHASWTGSSWKLQPGSAAKEPKTFCAKREPCLAPD